MAEPIGREGEEDRLRDPEYSAAPDPEGVTNRKFMGIPVWATAVGFAVLMVVMYLLMGLLT